MGQRSSICWPIVLLLWPIHLLLMMAYFRVTIRHAERLPRRGPVILAPIHRSRWDSLLLFHLMGGPLNYLAWEGEFKGIQGWLMSRMGAIPLNTEEPATGTMRHALDLIVAHKPLVIFPEGTIFYYPPGDIHPIKQGAAWLARCAAERLGSQPVSLVPIRLNLGDRFLRFRSRIEIVVQQPIMVSHAVTLPRKESIQKITAQLQSSLGDNLNTSVKERFPAHEFRRKVISGSSIEAPEAAQAR